MNPTYKKDFFGEYKTEKTYRTTTEEKKPLKKKKCKHNFNFKLLQNPHKKNLTCSKCNYLLLISGR